ncbi:hypothetical protein X777_14047 [Ooceraea biroi]|uniref:Uncharacterized protein n=1 Tax=Ooceraea biroi TaxID=2015173 RepID=A0A026VWQ0_OOCBI|nr:hypothetical protein X777_14047 [Ooceraea biroi]
MTLPPLKDNGRAACAAVRLTRRDLKPSMNVHLTAIRREFAARANESTQVSRLSRSYSCYPRDSFFPKIEEKLRFPRRTPATSDINFKFLLTAPANLDDVILTFDRCTYTCSGTESLRE